MLNAERHDGNLPELRPGHGPYDDYHGRTLEPTKIDVESFIKENQVYLDKVSKLKKYFKELDKN